MVDVTERRQAEEFRSIAMNQMAEGLFTVDVKGLLTSMNQSAAEMLGWTEEELFGKEMNRIVLANDQVGRSAREIESSWTFGPKVDMSYWTITCTVVRTVHFSRLPFLRHLSSLESPSKVP